MASKNRLKVITSKRNIYTPLGHLGDVCVKYCMKTIRLTVVEISSGNETRTHDRTARHAADNISRPTSWMGVKKPAFKETRTPRQTNVMGTTIVFSKIGRGLIALAQQPQNDRQTISLRGPTPYTCQTIRLMIASALFLIVSQ